MTAPARALGFERGALVAAGLFTVYVLTRYDMCFQDGELFSPVIYDSATRPRILTYLANMLAFETRLALWHVVPPHPSFTPVWALTLVVTPLLLWRFLRLELDSGAAASAGTAVYLTSVGYLSGATMLFHHAKPLANLVVVATLYLSARLRRVFEREGEGAALPRGLTGGLLLVLALAPFADETAAFAYLIPFVWCPSLFWRWHHGPARLTCARNWLVFTAPAAAAAAVLLFVIPKLFSVVNPSFDMIQYLRGLAEAGAAYHKWDLEHVVWQGGNLLIPGLLPWTVANVQTPVAAEPDVPVAALCGLAVLAGLLTVAIYRGRRVWGAYRRAVVLAVVFILFNAVVMVFHELELSSTGYYYGAIFSLLFAALVAAAFAHATSGGTPARAAARLGLIWVLAISAANFPLINASWIAHSTFKTLLHLNDLPIDDLRAYGADLGPLHARYAELAALNAQAGSVEEYYMDDVPRQPPDAPFADAFRIWRRWRSGDPDFLAGTRLGVREAWLAVELSQLKSGRLHGWRRPWPWRT